MMILDVPHPEVDRPSIRVAVIGSCRVRDMLFDAYAPPMDSKDYVKPFCETVWYKFGSFTHTAPQALQYYRYLKSKESFFEEIQPLIFFRYESEFRKKVESLTPEIFKSIDMFILELSTLNSFECKGVYVNSSYTEQKFIRRGGKPLLKWWRSVCNEKFDLQSHQLIVNETLNSLPLKDLSDSKQVRYIVQNLRRNKISENEFFGAIETLLMEFGKPTIIVPIFDIHDTPVVARSKLRNMVEEFSKVLNYNTFDTTNLVKKVGRNVALDGNGSSVNHYSPAFHHLVVKEFSTYIHNVWDQQSNRQLAQKSA